MSTHCGSTQRKEILVTRPAKESILKKQNIISALSVAAAILTVTTAHADENTTNHLEKQVTSLKIAETTHQSKVDTLTQKVELVQDMKRKVERMSTNDESQLFMGEIMSQTSVGAISDREKKLQKELIALLVEQNNIRSKRLKIEATIKKEEEAKAKAEAERIAKEKEEAERAAAAEAERLAEEAARNTGSTATLSGTVTAGSLDVNGIAYHYGGAGTYPVGECTWGVKVVAPWAGPYWGNGGDWAASAAAAGFRTGKTPQVGAIASWNNGGYGHVAYVIAVESENRIQVLESNYYHRNIANQRGWFDPTTTSEGVVTYIYPN